MSKGPPKHQCHDHGLREVRSLVSRSSACALASDSLVSFDAVRDCPGTPLYGFHALRAIGDGCCRVQCAGECSQQQSDLPARLEGFEGLARQFGLQVSKTSSAWVCLDVDAGSSFESAFSPLGAVLPEVLVVRAVLGHGRCTFLPRQLWVPSRAFCENSCYAGVEFETDQGATGVRRQGSES